MPTREPRSQLRARYVRTNADLLTNNPGGFPSAFAPVASIPFPAGESVWSDQTSWWYGSDAGAGRYPVGPNGPFVAGGEAISAVTRATSLIVDPLIQVRWRVVDQDPMNMSETAGRQLPIPRWVTDPMLLRDDMRITEAIFPAPIRFGASDFWGGWIRHALWWGLGAIMFVESPEGYPTAGTMRLVHPGMISPVRNDAGVLVWRIGDESEYVDTDRDGYIVVGGVRWRVVTIRNPHSEITPEGFSMGVFAQHPETFGLARQMENYASGTYRSGVPAGYLKVQTPGLSQEDATGLKQAWMNAHGGDRKSIAVLNATTDFHALNLSPVDAALVEMKRASLLDIAHAFNLEPSMLGAPSGDSMTYSNIESRYSFYRVSTLGRWVTQIQETLRALLPGNQMVFLDLRTLLRADTATRYESYSRAIADGWLTVDEVRGMEGLSPLSGGGTDGPAE